MQKVTCRICSLEFKALGYHLRSHNISKQEYCDKYDLKIEDLSSEESRQKRYIANSRNGKLGNDKIQEMLLDPEYKLERGQKISLGILASEHAIEMRKNTLTNLNKSEEFRSKSSSTMKKTWTENSKMSSLSHQWQLDDPDRLREILEKARAKFYKVKGYSISSKAERAIIEELKLNFEISRKPIKILESYREYDIRIDSENIYIEIDGPWHFKFFYNRFDNDEGYFLREKSDFDKSTYCLENNIFLLRVQNVNNSIEEQLSVVRKFLDLVKSNQITPDKIYWYGELYRDYNWSVKNEEIKYYNF